jgi:hypothetical protein
MQTRIRIECGLDLRSRAGVWPNDRASVRAVRTKQGGKNEVRIRFENIRYIADHSQWHNIRIVLMVAQPLECLNRAYVDAHDLQSGLHTCTCIQRGPVRKNQ